ncbi:MAG TPA: ribonuclease H-like domain-containing protein, partial [Spirochaetota bacterium]|nr:ribonuclease H-like domain-containing protein [Spirochaetota bacterium]
MLIPDNVRAKVLKQEKGNTTAMDESDVKYLVFDIESVPDAKLIKKVKYPDQVIDDEAAVRKFQEEVLALTSGATTFIPVTFQYPLCICIAKVRSDFTIADIVSLDEPKFRPSEMTDLFWRGVEKQYGNAALVTFNGRGFDVPLMELMAFRYGITAQRHLKDKFGSRYRFGTKHIDLHDWLSNFNAIRMTGGLNLLAKVLGKPGKM